MPLSSVKNHCN
jgi:hypothetical protein